MGRHQLSKIEKDFGVYFLKQSIEILHTKECDFIKLKERIRRDFFSDILPSKIFIDDSKCFVCWDEDVKLDKMFAPCGHVICSDCSGHLAGKTCPLCRQLIILTGKINYQIQ